MHLRRSFFILLIRCPPRSPLFPYTTLFRSAGPCRRGHAQGFWPECNALLARKYDPASGEPDYNTTVRIERADRKSTRLNSSHLGISYAVFCLKKKKKITYNK